MKREKKQDALWRSLFCGTQMVIFDRGLGQSSSKMPKKHDCAFFTKPLWLYLFDGTHIYKQKYFWRMKIWRHIIRDLKTAVLNRGLKMMTQLYYEQIHWLKSFIWYIDINIYCSRCIFKHTHKMHARNNIFLFSEWQLFIFEWTMPFSI